MGGIPASLTKYDNGGYRYNIWSKKGDGEISTAELLKARTDSKIIDAPGSVYTGAYNAYLVDAHAAGLNDSQALTLLDTQSRKEILGKVAAEAKAAAPKPEDPDHPDQCHWDSAIFSGGVIFSSGGVIHCPVNNISPE